MTQLLLDVIQLSRPRFWLYLAGPFVIGFLSGAPNPVAFLSFTFVLPFIFFLIPANVFLYGVNDLADEDTDLHNDKKKKYELALSSAKVALAQKAVAASVLLSLVLIFVSGSVQAAGVYLLFLFLGYAYSQKPFRWKALPFIDSASNVLYVLPGLIGFYLATGNFPSFWLIVGCGLWTAAMHLFSAIPDIQADTTARLKTTAVVFGERTSLLLCSALWFLSAVLLYTVVQQWWVLVICLYSAVPLVSYFRKVTPARLYRVFPFLNAGLGFLLFWCIFFARFGFIV